MARPSNEELMMKVQMLESENQKLKEQIPHRPISQEGHQFVFIKSEHVAAIKKEHGKFLPVDVTGTDDMGNPFNIRHEVLCDQQVEVPNVIANALKGIIESQKG